MLSLPPDALRKKQAIKSRGGGGVTLPDYSRLPESTLHNSRYFSLGKDSVNNRQFPLPASNEFVPRVLKESKEGLSEGGGGLLCLR